MLKVTVQNNLIITDLTYSEIEHIFKEIIDIFNMVNKSKNLSELALSMNHYNFHSFTYGFTPTTMWVKQYVGRNVIDKVIILVEIN